MTEFVAGMPWKIKACYEDMQVVLIVGMLTEHILSLFLVVLLLRRRLATLQRCVGEGEREQRLLLD